MKETVKKIVHALGLNLQSAYGYAQNSKYRAILEEIIAENDRDERATGCTVVVFSKDRACQLHALLQSYHHFVKNPADVHVLWTAEGQDLNRGYEKLQETYRSIAGVHFHKQVGSFKASLQQVIQKVPTEQVMFLVDDILFKNPFNFADVTRVNSTQHILSLRHGSHLDYSYTNDKPMPLPKFSNSTVIPGALEWEWVKGAFAWGYPLSVDGHVLRTSEVLVLVRECQYQAPNSFEHALLVAAPLFYKRRGICFPEAAIVNIPCNKVQTEVANFSGDISVDEINKKWLQGYQIDFLAHKGIRNTSTHQELALQFIPQSHG